MLNIAKIIQGELDTYWTRSPIGSSDYSVTEPKITWKMDEFNPLAPFLQILLENGVDKKTWLVDTLYKVEHKCKITLHLKPKLYSNDAVERFKTYFFECKNQVDNILAIRKYDMSGFDEEGNSVVLVDLRQDTGWDDKGTITRGLGKTSEPSLWKSIIEVTAVYYIEGGITPVPLTPNKNFYGRTVESVKIATVPRIEHSTESFAAYKSGIMIEERDSYFSWMRMVVHVIARDKNGNLILEEDGLD